MNNATPEQSINLNEPRFRLLEFAKMASIGRTKAFFLVKRGEVASLVLGNKIWITESAVKAYLAKCSRPEIHGDDKPTPDGHKLKAIQRAASRKARASSN